MLSEMRLAALFRLLSKDTLAGSSLLCAVDNDGGGMDKEERHADKLKEGEYLRAVDENFSAYVNAEFGKRTPGKTKVLAASLTLTSVSQECYGTHCSNFYQLGRDHPDVDVAFITPRRMAIDGMRNLAVKLAITGDFDYLYFFDDDTVNDRDVLGRLLPRMEEFNAISAAYFVRGYPFPPMAFKWKYSIHKGQRVRHLELYKPNGYHQLIDKDGVLRRGCGAVGCGCTLFRVKDFTLVPYPWFKTGLHHTEDVYWFLQAHAKIPDYKVGMDFNINCGHLLNPIFVDATNVAILRRFYRQLKKVGGISQ